MATTFDFTYCDDPGRKPRWRTIYKGKRLYFPANLKAKDEAYKRAQHAYKLKVAELDGLLESVKPNREDYELAIRKRQNIIDWIMNKVSIEGYDIEDFKAEYELSLKEIAQLKKDFSKQNPPAFDELSPIPINPVDRMQWDDRRKWENRILTLVQHQKWTKKETDPDKSLTTQIDNFIRAKEERARIGEIKPNTLRNVTWALAHYQRFCNGMTTDAINSQHISAYKTDLLSRVAQGEIKKVSAAAIANWVRAFIRFLYKQEILDREPRNIDELTIKASVGEPNPFEIPFVKSLLSETEGRIKLYILLAINCGMTQVDISDIHPDEVLWDTGHIFRKRSKTKDEVNVPKVKYKLWPATLELLNRYRTSDPEHVLLSQNGKILVYNKFRSDEALDITSNDNIRRALKDWCRKKKRLKPNGQPDEFQFKRFRKTSASLISNHEDFRGLEDLFLDHSAAKMSGKHYCAVDGTTLDKAIDYLASVYGI